MIRATCRVAAREFAALVASPTCLLLALLVPLAYALLFSGIYWNKKVTHVPLVVVDSDHSALSRQLLTGLQTGESFRFAGYLDKPEDFLPLAIKDQANVLVVFPPGMERDVKKGKETKVAVFVDATSILIGNVAIAAASTVFTTYSVGIDARKYMLRGMASPANVLTVARPITDEYRIWYNPAFNYNYTNFMLLGLVMIAVQLLSLLLVASAGSREHDPRRAAELAGITRHLTPVVLGKLLPYLAVMLPSSMVALYLPAVLLDVPMLGSPWLLVAITAWLIAILTVVGTGVSALLGDALQTTEVFAVVAMPSYLLSGYTWPTFAMPPGLQVVSYALPLSPYVMAVRRLTLQNAGLEYLGPQILALCIWSGVALLVGYLGAWRLRRLARHKEATPSA